jgi:membrane-associated HD superfamily phosphohydrolase
MYVVSNVLHIVKSVAQDHFTDFLVAAGVTTILFGASIASESKKKYANEQEALQQAIIIAEETEPILDDQIRIVRELKAKKALLTVKTYLASALVVFVGVSLIFDALQILKNKNSKMEMELFALKERKRFLYRFGNSVYTIFAKYRTEVISIPSLGPSVDERIFSEVNQFVNGCKIADSVAHLNFVP